MSNGRGDTYLLTYLQADGSNNLWLWAGRDNGRVSAVHEPTEDQTAALWSPIIDLHFNISRRLLTRKAITFDKARGVARVSWNFYDPFQE